MVSRIKIKFVKINRSFRSFFPSQRLTVIAKGIGIIIVFTYIPIN